MARRKKAVTLKDLSERLGVSPFTISRALSGKGGMSEETRQRILQVAREMGYRVKEESGEARPLALVIPFRLLNAMSDFGDLVRGAEAAAREHGCTLTPVIAHSDNGGTSLPEGLRAAAGAIYLPLTPQDWLQRALEQGPPAVVIDFAHRTWRADSVVWDAEAGAGLCVDHLVAAGYRQLGYVGSPEVAPGYRLRWAGFQAAVREHGLEVDPAHCFFPIPWPPEACLASVRELLSRAPSLPQALVCDFETTAMATHRVLLELGRTDVRLACADQLSAAALMAASIPHLCYHREQVGRRAVERLVRRLARPTEPYERIRVAVSLRT